MIYKKTQLQLLEVSVHVFFTLYIEGWKCEEKLSVFRGVSIRLFLEYHLYCSKLLYIEMLPVSCTMERWIWAQSDEW